MRIQARCRTHSTVLRPADVQWHFMEIEPDTWELDLADTWCPVGSFDGHECYAIVTDDDGNWLCEVDL